MPLVDWLYWHTDWIKIIILHFYLSNWYFASLIALLSLPESTTPHLCLCLNQVWWQLLYNKKKYISFVFIKNVTCSLSQLEGSYFCISNNKADSFNNPRLEIIFSSISLLIISVIHYMIHWARNYLAVHNAVICNSFVWYGYLVSKGLRISFMQQVSLKDAAVSRSCPDCCSFEQISLCDQKNNNLEV